MYPLMENHIYALEMQKEMIDDIEKAKPKIIVYANVVTSWSKRPESNQLVLEWLQEYCNQNYILVGVADILSPEETVFVWGIRSKSYIKKSDTWLYVLKRIT